MVYWCYWYCGQAWTGGGVPKIPNLCGHPLWMTPKHMKTNIVKMSMLQLSTPIKIISNQIFLKQCLLYAS